MGGDGSESVRLVREVCVGESMGAEKGRGGHIVHHPYPE